MRRVFVLAVVALAWSAGAGAQTQPDPIAVTIERVTAALSAQDRAAFAALFAPTVATSLIDRYTNDLMRPGAVRTVVRERDRGPLEAVPPGDGYRMVVEIFVETPGRGRILNAEISIRRPPGGNIDSWRIVGADGLSSVEGLLRLRLNTTRVHAARNLEVLSEDLVLSLPAGEVFLVECDDGVTGLVLVGRGEMRFSPAPAAERGQVRLFAGSETLTTPFEYAFVRLHPSDYDDLVVQQTLTPLEGSPRQTRRAQEIFAREAAKSFAVDLQDLSSDQWWLLPPQDDLIAEVRTTRFDTLTFTKSTAQAEDISLSRRQDRRTIALYASVAKLAARGRYYSDDVLREYDVLDYSVEASIVPDRMSMDARARLSIRVRSTSLTTLMLRLAEDLEVTSVTSVEYGRMLFLRLRGQNTILVNMPRVMQQDSDLTLIVTYAGRLTSQDLDIDTVQVRSDEPPGSSGANNFEPVVVLSNRSFWYPQNPVPDYATASIRVVVPPGYRAVASGALLPVTDEAPLRDLLTMPNGQAFSFRANQPLRYLALAVSRFARVAETTVSIGDLPTVNADGDRVVVAVEAHRSLQARGRQTVRVAEEIIRFFAGLVGDTPYPSATIALLESELPGGHSPGYFVLLSNPPLHAEVTWRNDPAMFDGFPEFFLAHELAHQWWGQGVGWKNYHEQWISEGFSQYFAALYAQKARGDRMFVDMLRQFRRWAIAESDQGPVHLGYRLGHLKNEPRVFRALVYNKGAAVLHMLRRLIGDEAFFDGIRRLYADRRYQKAGTEDVERAMEAASGRTLDRFFERWIYGTAMPRIAYSSAITEGAVVLSFEQLGELVFDLPVTVTLVQANGESVDVIVPITDKQVEHRIPTTVPVRQVHLNRDAASLAEFEETRRR